MKTSALAWRMTIAALLALAVIFVWPSDDARSFSPDSGQLQSLHNGHRTAESWHGAHDVRHRDADAHCDFSGLGCCAMMHCHPGITIEAQDMTVFAADADTTVAAGVRAAENGPGVVLPPPRRSPV